MEELSKYSPIEDFGTTVVHPVGLAVLALCGLLFLLLPRKYAPWPFLMLVCFISGRQCVAFGTFNLFFARLFYLVLLPLRLVIRDEARGLRFHALDWTVLVYGVSILIVSSVNFGLDPAVLKVRSGLMVDIIGSYLLFRTLVRDVQDVRSIVTCLATVSLCLVGFFCVENQSGRNLFSVFGGVPEITAVREGRLRCQGAFTHPIVAGAAVGSFLPLLIYGSLKMRPQRLLLVPAACAAMVVVYFCASSTPLIGLMITLTGWLLYPWRRFSRLAFASLGILLVILHFAMKAPVWALIQRINIVGGNSGYHRYMLVDGFINHWDEWWFAGTTIGTAHWGPWTWDTSNQFVAVGAMAGIFVLALFLWTIALAIGGAGRIGRTAPMLGWALAITIVSHCAAFFGVSVWSQMHIAWSLPLALIGSLSCPAEAASRRKQEAAKRQRLDSQQDVTSALGAVPDPSVGKAVADQLR